MIFAGPSVPNPTEILEKRYFDELLEFAKQQFDYVLIDSAPIGAAIDAAVIAKKCDGAVIVIASKEISYRFAQKIKEQLEKAECRILGCVLNKVNISQKSYYGKYYGKYYGQYYGNDYEA